MSATHIVLLTPLAQALENQPQRLHSKVFCAYQTSKLRPKKIFFRTKLPVWRTDGCSSQAPLYLNAESLIRTPPPRSYRSMNGTFLAFAIRLHGLSTRLGPHSFDHALCSRHRLCSAAFTDQEIDDRDSKSATNGSTPFCGTPFGCVTLHERRDSEQKKEKTTGGRGSAPLPPIGIDYQLAFVTPGIKPCEAISRNWIRLIPNRRM